MHTSVPVELFFTEFVLRPVKGFSERSKSIVSVYDNDASLNGTKRLDFEPFADNW